MHGDASATAAMSAEDTPVHHPALVDQEEEDRDDDDDDTMAGLEAEFNNLDADLDVEKVQFYMTTWRSRIKADAKKLYQKKGSTELWSHYGHDAKAAELGWVSHTCRWIKKHLVGQTRPRALEAQYTKYVSRFRKVIKAMRLKKRDDDLASAMKKYSHMVKINAAPTVSELVSLSSEKEGASALFLLLKQSPALISNVRRE